MLEKPVSNSGTSLVRRRESIDEELASAPASLFSVPSFGTDEWRNFRFNALMDTSTTASSPISPDFPRNGSGSSTGIARSYSTTPLSSTSNEVPRSGWPLLLDPSPQIQLGELNPKRHRKFILEEPAMAKHKKDKAMRACTHCFTKRLECSESELPNRCTHCVGKTSYCKGPIETPRLLNLEWMDEATAAILRCFWQSVELRPGHEYFQTVQVDLRLEPPSERDVVSNSQIQSLQLPALRNDFHFLWESSNLDSILDATFPADVPLCIAPKPGLYDLFTYECLCRRFCVCISLLRRPSECTLPWPYKNNRGAVQVIIGFLCLLARTASSTYAEIFEHLRQCCFATRDRWGTRTLMFTLAEHLGQMHKELRRFMDVKGRYSDWPPLGGLLHNASRDLDKLENLGRGLCSKGFESTYQSMALDIPGIHLVPCFEPRPYAGGEENFALFSQHLSFLDILRDSNPVQYLNSDQPVPFIHGNDATGRWGHLHVENSRLPIEYELQNRTDNDQDMILGDHGGFAFWGLQTEANAIFNPEWSLMLDESALLVNPEANVDEANVGTDYSDARTLEPVPHSQYLGWDHRSGAENQADYACFQGVDPGYGHARTGGGMLISPKDVTAPSQAQSNPIQQLEITYSHTFSNLAKPLLPLSTAPPEEIPKGKSKRKRIKAALSRKKPCLTPSYRPHDNDPSASKIGLSSRYNLGTQANKPSTNAGKMSMGQPDRDSPGRHQAVCLPAWEQEGSGCKTFENVGIDVSNSERRPMSWPHRNPWRRSLDISVAVLTKGFERLVTEKSLTTV